MNAITLRDIPPKVQAAIRQRADAEGLSLDRAVLRLLEETTGRPSSSRALHHDIDHLAGTWSAEEADVFDRALAEQRGIDREIWR